MFKFLFENVQKEPFVSPSTLDLLTKYMVTINAKLPASKRPKIIPNIIRMYLLAVVVCCVQTDLSLNRRSVFRLA